MLSLLSLLGVLSLAVLGAPLSLSVSTPVIVTSLCQTHFPIEALISAPLPANHSLSISLISGSISRAALHFGAGSVDLGAVSVGWRAVFCPFSEKNILEASKSGGGAVLVVTTGEEVAGCTSLVASVDPLKNNAECATAAPLFVVSDGGSFRLVALVIALFSFLVSSLAGLYVYCEWQWAQGCAGALFSALCCCWASRGARKRLTAAEERKRAPGRFRIVDPEDLSLLEDRNGEI
jgi:hypothetical protein